MDKVETKTFQKENIIYFYRIKNKEIFMNMYVKKIIFIIISLFSVLSISGIIIFTYFPGIMIDISNQAERMNAGLTLHEEK